MTFDSAFSIVHNERTAYTVYGRVHYSQVDSSLATDCRGCYNQQSDEMFGSCRTSALFFETSLLLLLVITFARLSVDGM